MKIHCRIVRLGVLSFVLMFTLGCSHSPTMGKYTYRVTLDSALLDKNTNMMPSIEVDFVGVNESEIARWRSQDIDDYFTSLPQIPEALPQVFSGFLSRITMFEEQRQFSAHVSHALVDDIDAHPVDRLGLLGAASQQQA